MDILIEYGWIIPLTATAFLLWKTLSLGQKNDSTGKASPNWGVSGADKSFLDFLTYVWDWPYTKMPPWMVDIINQECQDEGVEPPETLTTKYIDDHAEGYYLGGVGGYTVHSVAGEICIVYHSGRYFGTNTEKHTLLHELAHWIVKDTDDGTGGHTIKFYAELTRLALKHNVGLEELFEESNNRFGGDNVFPGLQMFDIKFNEGV